MPWEEPARRGCTRGGRNPAGGHARRGRAGRRSGRSAVGPVGPRSQSSTSRFLTLHRCTARAPHGRAPSAAGRDCVLVRYPHNSPERTAQVAAPATRMHLSPNFDRTRRTILTDRPSVDPRSTLGRLAVESPTPGNKAQWSRLLACVHQPPRRHLEYRTSAHEKTNANRHVHEPEDARQGAASGEGERSDRTIVNAARTQGPRARAPVTEESTRATARRRPRASQRSRRGRHSDPDPRRSRR